MNIEAAFLYEMAKAKNLLSQGDDATAFHHLERAHILGQRHTWRHVVTHAWMLRIAWRRQDLREVLGQMARIPAALAFSAIWVPLGNTGGANVGAFRPMPLPEDLQKIFLAEK